MPVISDLRSDKYEERHWVDIEELIGLNANSIKDPELTLEKLIKMEVNDKKEKIGEIAVRAAKEADLL
eukprot:CAMPEP_0201285932 /NCGR_PEP_ID=MMETSP1317-20130820/114036_1 /ASSEMBLY_ACC=CAM_ASM_000770 /TAXON_ID=187299 /ORGANISM="Undescribed Undescribed, Strain Undescribed" /LENGTH=67 /DNA_ID=CAMNT_0047612161 /DNA_START=313 /DNA_END=516 /DNA_ORIENTATION=-